MTQGGLLEQNSCWGARTRQVLAKGVKLGCRAGKLFVTTPFRSFENVPVVVKNSPLQKTVITNNDRFFWKTLKVRLLNHTLKSAGI